MNYNVSACKNCRKIAKTTKDHKCANCGAIKENVPLYTWYHQDLNLMEKPEVIDRLDEMDNTEIKSTFASGAELKVGLRDLLICVGIAAFMLLFGLLCIGGASGHVRGRMSFMGLLFLIGAPGMLIVGLYLFFKRTLSGARAKTPEKAFTSFWNTVFELKTFSSKYESAEVAAARIARSMPPAVLQSMNGQQLQSWINDLRSLIAKSNDELAAECSKSYKEEIFDAKGDEDSLTIQNLSTQIVDEHKAVVSADLVVSRKWTRYLNNKNQDSFSYQMSAGVLHARTTLLKAGNYWYVPDWMPGIEKVGS